METIFKCFAIGYVIGMACLLSQCFKARGKSNLLGKMLLCAGVSFGWSFVGVCIHLLLRNYMLFVQLSQFLFVLIVGSLILLPSKMSHKSRTENSAGWALVHRRVATLRLPAAE